MQKSPTASDHVEAMCSRPSPCARHSGPYIRLARGPGSIKQMRPFALTWARAAVCCRALNISRGRHPNVILYCELATGSEAITTAILWPLRPREQLDGSRYPARLMLVLVDTPILSFLTWLPAGRGRALVKGDMYRPFGCLQSRH